MRTLAAEAGATVVRLDGRELLPSPQAVLEALGEVLDVPSGEGAIAGPSDGGRLVVLCDTYERLAPLDDWVRTRLLPRLPATALTVVAGRRAHRVRPGAPTRRGVSCLRVVSLRNLSPSDSRQYLHACGVDPARHDQLVELAHGHPLGAVAVGRCVRAWRRDRGRSAHAGPGGHPAATVRRDRPQRSPSPGPGGVRSRPSDHRGAAAGGARAGGCARAVLLAARAVVHGVGSGRCVSARSGPRRPGGRSALA